MRRLVPLVLAVAVTVAVAACDRELPLSADLSGLTYADVERVDVSPPLDTLMPARGDSVVFLQAAVHLHVSQFQTRPMLSQGEVTIAWVSLNPTVARVDNAGRVAARSVGTATILAIAGDTGRTTIVVR